MLIFLFTDIEGSTRLWEEHTAVMTGIIARHDEILQELIEAHGGRITKHTGDGITAVFDGGQPLACALETQVRFAAEPWEAIGALPIRAGLHAGEAEYHPSAGTPEGDYFGPPVNATARIMSAAWGGQILLTPEVTDISPLPVQATLLDLGEHLLKNVTTPQQLYQLLHPQLPRQEFPPPRTLSGQSIRRAVEGQGDRIANLPPPSIAVTLVSATLAPMLQGDLSPDSPALVGNLGVLDDLGAGVLRDFTAGFAAQLQARQEAGQAALISDVRQRLEGELLERWAAGDDTSLALQAAASHLLQAVHGVQAAMTAATGDVRMALAQGLADLGSQFVEFRWMLAGVQDTLAEMRARQELQLSLQREQLAKTEEILEFQREQVRGPVPAYLPEAKEPPTFLETDEEWYQPPVFVARERELARLEDFLQTALACQGGVVFVTGGPGRGKTALLNEFSQRAMEAHPDLLVASGNCNAYSGVGDPYLPFREVLDMLTGDVEARWAAGAITRAHAQRLWQTLPAAVEALLDHGPHVIGTLVRGGPLLARAAAASPESTPWLERLRERLERERSRSEALEQSHLFQQVTHVLRALAEAHPLLLIVDDLQWTDTASAGLLFHLGRRLQGSPILLAGTYRPDEVALDRDAGRHPRVREQHPLAKALVEFKRTFGDVWLDLAEVQAPEGRHFVDALLETEPNRLGEDFCTALFEHTGGHPLFTVELLRAMQERGDLVQERAGRWVVGPALDWETLPARVEGVIEARIGRLQEEQRETLSVASVEGETFTAQVVARVQEIGERKLLQTLSRQLERKYRLVREQGEEQVGHWRLSRYRFAHALFQRYLYNDLSPGECRLLHGEVAAVLEELYEGQLEEVAVALARHFSGAGDDPRSLKYFTLAGDVALAAYAHPEAEDHYRRALELAPGESRRARLLSSLGEALLGQGRFQEAMGTWRQGIELYRALDDSDGLARLYARSARAASEAGEPAEDLRLCLEGLASVEGAPDSPGLARLLDKTARAHYLKALREQARPFAEQALEMAERLGDVEIQVHALATLGGFGLPPWGDDLEALARAVDLAESNGLLDAASRAHNNLGVAMAIRGDLDAARQHYRRTAELDRQAGDIAGQSFVLTNLVRVSMWCGDFEEAETTLARIHVLLNDLTEPSQAADDVVHCEMVLAGYRGEWVEAARRARVQQTSARERGADLDLAPAGSWLARAVLESRRLGGDATAGKWEEAEAALAEAIEIYDRSTYRFFGVEARVWLGILRVTQSRLDDARRLLAEGREKAASQSSAWTEAFLLLLAAQIAGAEGRWGEALAAFEAAAGIHARYGTRWYWARWLLDWAGAHAARGEPGDRERAGELLREAQAAFEEMGIPRYAAVARDRLEALEQ